MRFAGPFVGETVYAFYGLVDNGKTAVIEIAACAGLPLMEGRFDPARATTYGVGELMMDAAKRGVTKIIVGLGGSATNDGGCGAASAVGIRFYDADGKAFIPTGGTLTRIARIDCSGKATCLDGVMITAMCDIDNPMYGDNGAAAVFGPQKGADPSLVEELDRGLRHLSEMMQEYVHQDVSKIPGAGAAGAMGAGMLALFGADLRMGIDTVLDVIDFEDIIKDASLVLTGEGKIDTQSLRGKVVIGVARRAKPFGVPVIAVVGGIGDNIQGAYEEGVSGIVSINRMAVDFEIANGKGVIYVQRISKMKEYAEKLKSKYNNLNVQMIWSLNNEKHPMTDDQYAVWDSILENEEIPSGIDILFINASCETCINIRNIIDFMIIESWNIDTIKQVRGRYRDDLFLCYFPSDKPSYINVPKCQREAKNRDAYV